MTKEKTTCPSCKEELKAGAVKCKHCHSKLALEHPEHKGICPFCKEEVNPEAIKCKHCKSQIGGSTDTAKQSCGCSDPRQGFDSDANGALFRRRSLKPWEWPEDGQGCFAACRDYGGSHDACELWCEISMPRTFRDTLLMTRR